jgi:putative ABC transport system permease protein
MPNPFSTSPLWRRYLRFLGPDVEGDVEDELRLHLEERTAEYIARGMSPEEAERAALARFGDLAAVRRELAEHDRARERSQKRKESARDLIRDLRIALRGFRRTPGFLATAVVILGVGIGTSVAMLTVFRTVLLRQLPVLEQDRVVVMRTFGDDPSTSVTSGTQDLSVVRDEARTMSAVAAIAHWPASPLPFAYGERSMLLNRGMVTGNFFDVLGVRPALGRLLQPADDEPPCLAPRENSAPSPLVLSHRGWTEAFGGDPTVVGRRLVEPLLKTEYTIVGVAPPGFAYPAGVDYWIPMWCGWQSGVSAFAVARLAPVATLDSARDEYFAIMQRLDEQRSGSQLNLRGASVATFGEAVLGDVRPVLALLTAAVALLLLIACLNVGNLLLLRASSRTEEIAVRRALGASLGQVVRQLLVEAVVIAAAGGALGILVAVSLLRLLVAYAPPNLPRLDEIQLGGAPLPTAVTVTAIAVLLFGVAPALLAAREDPAGQLRIGSRAGGDSRGRRTARQTLVAAQIALAVVMLGGAGLLGRSLDRLVRQDTGFESDNLSILWYSWDAGRYDSSANLRPLGDRLVQRIEALPGVTAATQTVVPPMLGNAVWQIPVATENEAGDDAADDQRFAAEYAGPGYFDTFGVPLLRGRTFTEADREGAPPVAIVSESAADRLWPGQDPMGKQLRVPGAWNPSGNPRWLTVVGVAHDTHLRTLREVSPTIYLPALQGSWQGYVAIRSTRPLPDLVPALREAGHEVDPSLDLWSPRTMEDILDEPLAQPRLSAGLMSGFGLVALLLAAIGLFGVMASLVHERRREFGVRLALGASPGRVRGEVLFRAGMIAGCGMVVGLIAALTASRLMDSLLFQVSPTDPVALVGACVVLVTVAGAAAYLPARRATAIDPVEALRAD